MRNTLTLTLASLAAMAVSQDYLKPVRLERSAAAEKNNEGVELSLAGRFKEAAAAIDQASIRDIGNPTPWVNGAWVQFELGKNAQAFRANRQAMLMGDRSIRRLTLNIEIETARGQLGKAWKQVEAAEFQQPEEPYVHMGRAKWADAAAQSRVAERSRWQAFRMGRDVVLDSKLFSTTGASAGGGAVGQGRLDGRWRHAGEQFSGQVDARLSAETLGGRSNAKNQLSTISAAGDTPIGIVMGNYKSLRGDRPGPMSLLATPGAALRYQEWMLGWQERLGPFTVNLNAREAKADVRPNATTPFARNILQTQWMAEGRYDEGPWTFGAGLSQVYRTGVVNPAIEPFEDIFPNGKTRLSHLYGVHRLDVSKSIRLIAGGVLEQLGSKSHGLFTGELAVKVFGDKYLRLGVKPTMNRAGTVIFPEDLRARPLSENPVSTTYNSSLSTNRSTNLFTVGGKSMDMFASLPLPTGSNSSVNVTAFQKQFRQGQFMSGDVQLQRSLGLVPVASGKITGVTGTGTWTPTPSVELGTFFTVQSSRAAGYAKATSESRVPNVPDLMAGFTVDVNVSDLSFGLSANYVGSRVQAEWVDGAARTVRTQRLAPTWGVDLHVSYPIAGGTLHLVALNLTRSSFFRGYDSSRTLMLSYQTRF